MVLHSKTRVFTKKNALLVVFIAAFIIVFFLFFRWKGGSHSEIMTPDGRQKFLASLGWEVDLSSEEAKTVIIPEKFEGVMADYNQMQLEQGFDLSPYCGKQCRQYTYSLLNYPDNTENVYLSLYIKDSKVIGGDIHTNSVNGFMQGIMPSKNSE